MNTAAVKPADYMTNEEEKRNEQDEGEEYHHDAEQSFEGFGLQRFGKEEAVFGSPVQEDAGSCYQCDGG